jgi:hypothetical protein
MQLSSAASVMSIYICTHTRTHTRIHTHTYTYKDFKRKSFVLIRSTYIIGKLKRNRFLWTCWVHTQYVLIIHVRLRKRKLLTCKFLFLSLYIRSRSQSSELYIYTHIHTHTHIIHTYTHRVQSYIHTHTHTHIIYIALNSVWHMNLFLERGLLLSVCVCVCVCWRMLTYADVWTCFLNAVCFWMTGAVF